MRRERLSYTHDDTPLEAYVVCDGCDTPSPCVLVAHAWRGQDAFARGRARELASMGYVGFALDMYGPGQETTDPAQAAAWMTPFREDPALTRGRLHAALQAARALPQVDPSRVAIIGYCFGGACALELARSGADLLGAVSVHGLLSTRAPASPGAVQARVLALHGDADPMVPPAQVDAFREEMNAAHARWELHTYGGAMHAFSVPEANNPAAGVVYHPDAARRSWRAIAAFLDEIFC